MLILLSLKSDSNRKEGTIMMKIGSLCYFMQLCVAGSDGEIEDEEVEQIRQNMQQGDLLSMIMGLSSNPGHQSEGEMFEAGREYYNMHAAGGSLEYAFLVAAGGLPMDINWDMECLSAYYNRLVEIAAADGEIEPEEARLLDFVKAEWGV